MDFVHPSIFGRRSAPKSSTQSQRLQTAHALLEAYSSLDAARIESLLARTYTNQVLPLSLEMPVRDRAEFRKHAEGITAIFSTFSMTPQSMFEDPERNSMAMYVKMSGKTKNGGMQWENECVMMLGFSEDGREISEVREFVDSAKAKEMREKMAPKNFAEK